MSSVYILALYKRLLIHEDMYIYHYRISIIIFVTKSSQLIRFYLFMYKRFYIYLLRLILLMELIRKDKRLFTFILKSLLRFHFNKFR